MTTFTISARDLKGFLDPLLKVAGKDYDLPVLCAVHLRGIDGTLVGTSTDRFRMAFHRTKPASYVGDDFAALLSTTAIKRLLAVFKASRSLNPTLTVIVGTTAVEVRDDETSMTVAIHPGQYPAYGSLLAAAAKADPADTQGVFGINPKLMADLLATGGEVTAIRGPYGEHKPIVIQPSENLLYLLMPRRRINGEDVTPAIDFGPWADVMGAQA